MGPTYTTTGAKHTSGLAGASPRGPRGHCKDHSDPNAPMFRHAWYQSLFDAIPAIEREASALAGELDLARFGGRLGTYQGSSGCPARLPDYVLDEIVAANRLDVLPAVRIADDLRDLVKTVHGDEWDVCVTNTAEAGLRVALETLVAPPTMRKGEQYRSRMLQIYGEDAEWGGGYGRAFPPKYRHFAMDRTVAGGELGIDAKSLSNLDTLFVRAPGVSYAIHGVRQATTPVMVDLDVDATLAALERTADRHAAYLAGVHAVGYDTPGWGFGERDADGTPTLMRRMAGLAAERDVPFVVDCASCLPFVGLNPARVGADVMVYSMDKAGRAPISGLMIGREEPMNAVRKGMGWIGPRSGGTSSYSKGAFSMHDPGRDSLVGLYAFMKTMHETPSKVTDPVDGMHEILLEELGDFAYPEIAEGFLVTKSHHMGGIELNYANTWRGRELGVPLFNLEDMYCGSNTIDAALAAMGQAGATIYGGNVLIGPGLGLLDERGDLRPDAARAAFKGLVKAIEITCRHAGIVGARGES